MRRFIRICTVFCLAVLTAGGGWLGWLIHDLPAPEEIENRLAVPSIRIEDRHGRLLYEAGGDGRHASLASEQISDHLRWGTIATEDRNYYEHPGVDVEGILRAVWINIRGGEVLAGGSTITQQLARNLLLDDDEQLERTMRRKIRESWLAWRLAQIYDKDDILTFYLNQIYYGAHAHGIEAAAQTYFGRSATELSLAQTALLVGLPQAPSYYNPLVYPDEAKARQAIVLGLMLKDGHIDQAMHDQALAEPLPYSSQPYPIEAPHFVMMVQGEVDRLITADEQYLSGGLTVRTTLDLDWQQRGEEILNQQISRLQNPPNRSYSHEVSNGALVALHPETGDVLTLIGSPDYFDDGIQGAINMALVPRQPGSTLKPMVYAAGMDPDLAEPFTAATRFLDVETVFYTQKGEPYVPTNFSRTEHGPVLLRPALASSFNIPAVQALEMIGVDNGLSLMWEMGLRTFELEAGAYDLAFALGGGEVRLFDLTQAYATFANGGERVEPRLILEIQNFSGEMVYQAPVSERIQVLDERIAWLISDILSDNEARQASFGLNSVLQVGRPAAVKTGTTNDFRDNWTVGYTPDLVVGVWVGNVDASPMIDVTGISGAGPIWHQFIRSAVEEREVRPFVRPEGLIQTEVCALSGMLPSRACPFTRQEWFLAGTAPIWVDDIYRLVDIDTATGLLATNETPFERKKRTLVLDLPPEAYGWAQAEGITLLSDLFSRQDDFLLANGLATAVTAEPLRLLTPANNATYRWSDTLPAEAQRLPFQAVSDVALARLTFVVNGEVWGEVGERPFELFWQLSVGEHVVWLEAETLDGEMIMTEPVYFEVRPPEDVDGELDRP